jgi:hypothetical protein
LRGQSTWIATAKLIGTALASMYVWRYGDYPGSGLLAYLYVANFVVDLAYLAAVATVDRGVGVQRPHDPIVPIVVSRTG